MKLIFAGTPEFAAKALEALVACGHEVALVLTQPDRPAGRGMKLKPSAVKLMAQSLALRVEQPLTLKTPEAQALIASVQADAMIVAAYGLILPKSVLSLPRLGCLNIHASLLPKWRGAAPIQRAMLADDAQTGITIMQMDEGLDTGDMLLTMSTPIYAEDTAGSLHDRLAQLGASAICEALDKLPTLSPVAQIDEQASYAHKLEKSEAKINWQLDAKTVARRIRAFNPVLGAFSYLNGELCKIWFAQPVDFKRKDEHVGEIVRADSELWIACETGAVSVHEVQMAGGKRLPHAAFLLGKTHLLGQRFRDE